MARHSVEVNIRRRVELEIREEALSPQEVEQFARLIHHVNGPTELVKHAAAQVALHGSRGILFVEGMGQALMRTSAADAPDEQFPVVFRVVDQDVECEVVSC